MRIKSNPKRNIKLFELKDCQKGFISFSDVKAISGIEKSNLAINLKALVHPLKSDKASIQVFGTGDGKLDFEIDLSVFIVDDVIDHNQLDSGEKYEWHKIKTVILDNVLPYDDSDFDDEFFEDFYDHWIECNSFEKESLIKDIKDFFLRSCDSLSVPELVTDRKTLVKMMKSLNKSFQINYSDSDDEDFADFNNYMDDAFHKYDEEEKLMLLELFEMKLNFVSIYLLSSDRWRELPEYVFFEIRDYMVSIENYEILFNPIKYFKINKV